MVRGGILTAQRAKFLWTVFIPNGPPKDTVPLTGSHEVVGPIDPNSIYGPVGVGAQGFIPTTVPLPYAITFDNKATANAPAQVVTVTQQLDSNLDWSTFQLNDFDFDGQIYTIPAGLTSYTTRIDATSTVGVYVDVDADFNPLTGLLTWTFTSIDPATLDVPVGNVEEGFLPPDVTPPEGEGFIGYTIAPKANDPTGTVINAKGTVIFQAGLPGQSSLDTRSISNTIDNGPPTSTVGPLPPTETSNSFSVNWSGQDDPGGSGLASYDIYDSDDGGPFTPFLLDTTETSAAFTGQFGHTYSFYSVARDNVGNVEATPSAAEAETTIGMAVTSISSATPNPRNTPVSSVDVTFDEPINLSTFTSSALTLADNGGENLITSAATITLVSGSTYQIGGLAGLTTTDGNYTLTVNSTGIADQSGNLGSNSLSTSWLMDTTTPTSKVNPLPERETSLTFPVSVAGVDGGSPPSGIASYDLYSSTNGGPWTLWTTVPANNATANFSGQSDTTYTFYSIAHDLAGNTEVETPIIEASTYVPDLTPPVTFVDSTTGANPSSVNTSTATFTLNVTGSDSGGSGLAYFEVFVQVDQNAVQQVGAAIPAGATDSNGYDHATAIYQGLTDGQPHNYRFYSIGIDGAGNVETVHASPNDVIFSQEIFTQPSQLQVTGFTVEHGSPSRSYIRYLDITFNESDSQSGNELTSIINSIGTALPEIQIYKYDLNGDASSKTPVSLSSPTIFDVIDHAIEIDFGAGGIGGKPNTTAADGYYEVDIHLPSGQTAVHNFYRLLGDVNGDGIVDNNDLNSIAASIGESAPTGLTPLSADVIGSGTITAFDLTLATRSKGRTLGSGLSLG